MCVWGGGDESNASKMGMVPERTIHQTPRNRWGSFGQKPMKIPVDMLTINRSGQKCSKELKNHSYFSRDHDVHVRKSIFSMLEP